MYTEHYQGLITLQTSPSSVKKKKKVTSYEEIDKLRVLLKTIVSCYIISGECD
jgi:hypothetical protein